MSFKKYFQRIVYGTDVEYLSIIDEIAKSGSDFSLIVMGHSLDVTDKDIIKQLFALASEITVLYHNESALASYVSKLVELYGKDGFDELRTDTGLRFVSLATGMDEYIETIELKKFAFAYL